MEPFAITRNLRGQNVIFCKKCKKIEKNMFKKTENHLHCKKCKMGTG